MNIDQATLVIISFTLTFRCLESSADHQQLISDAANLFDQAALKVLESNFSPRRSSRSIKDKLDVTRQAMRRSGAFQNISIEKVIAVQNIKMTDPVDICAYHIESTEEKSSSSATQATFLAVAENSQGYHDYNSSVKIYKHSKDGILLDKTLPVYAPYRVAKITIMRENEAEHWLGVGGRVANQTTLDPKTKFVLYDIKNGYSIRFEMPMTVLAIKHVRTSDHNFVVVADKVSKFSTFITIMKYEPVSSTFSLHKRFPVAVVSALETAVIGKDAYLIVSIYMDFLGNLQAKSLVYKYDLHLQSFRLHTEFDTAGARDIATFYNGQSNYLVVANEASEKFNDENYSAPSFVYSIDGKFRLKPIAPVLTKAAKKVEVISFPSFSSKSFILALEGRDAIDSISVHSFDRDTLKATREQISIVPHVSSNGATKLKSFASFMLGTDLFVVVATAGANTTNVFKIKYQIQEVNHPMRKLFYSLKQELSKVTKALVEAEVLIARANEVIHGATYKEKGQDIEAKKRFMGDICAKSMLVKSIVFENGSIVYERNGVTSRADPRIYDANLEVNELESRLKAQQDKFRLAKVQMSNAVFVNGSRNLTGRFLIESARISSTPSIKSLNVASANGVNATFLVSDVVTLNANDVITGKKLFKGNVTVRDVEILGKLNNINLSNDVVTLNQDQVISSSRIEFDDFHFNDSLMINGTINGIHVSTDLLRLNINEELTGDKTFAANLNVGNCNLSGVLDGVNLTLLNKDSMLKGTNQIISGVKTFERPVYAASDLVVNGLIKEIDISKLHNEAVKIDSQSATSGWNHTFANPVRIKGNLSVSGTFNGLVIPDEILMVHGPQTISGVKKFIEGFSVAGNLTVARKLDGMKPDEFVSVSANDTISGQKKFMQKFVMRSDMDVLQGGRVNGVLLNQLDKEVVRIFGQQNLTGTYHFGEVNFDNTEPDIRGFIDDLRLSSYSELYSKAVLLNEDQIVTGHCIFSEETTVTGNLTASNELNGHRIPQDFLHNGEDQLIPAKFTFGQSVQLKRDAVINGNTSGFILGEIAAKLVAVDANGYVSGKKRFERNITVLRDLTTSKTINGVNLRDLMRKRTNQVAGYSGKNFNQAVMSSQLNVNGGIKVSQTIDQVDASELKRRSLMIDENTVIKETRRFSGNLTATNMKSSLINNVNIEKLVRDIVSLDEDQTIGGIKSFEEIQVNGNLRSNSTIDEIDVGVLGRNAVLQTGDTQIDENISFKDVRAKHHLEVAGRVHGISVQALGDDVILTTQDHDFKGNHSIIGNLAVKGSIKCNHLNTLNANEDIVLRNGNQRIMGTKKFVNDLIVNGAILLKGKANKVDIEELYGNTVTKSSQQVIYGKKRAGFIHSQGNITLSSSTIDGINLRVLKSSAVNTNRYCAIRGPVAFAGEALLQDSLQTQGLLNQKNFTDVITDAVSLSTKDVIHTDKRFLQGVSIAQDVTVNGNVYASGLVNGVHLTSLKDDILLNDGKQEVTGKKVFTQEVKCLSGLHKVGSINGISLENGIVVQGRKQNIYGKKSFTNIIAQDDVTVGELVDGYDISMLSQDTLRQNESLLQRVTGMKTFKGKPVFEKDLMVIGNLDGVPVVSGKFVDLHSNQLIENAAVFSSGVDIDADIINENSTISAQLADISKRRVTLDTNQKIYDKVVLGGSMIAKESIHVEGTVNGIYLTKTLDPNNWQKGVQTMLQRIESEKNSYCQAFAHINRIFKGSVSELDQFEDHQVFKDVQTEEMYNFKIGSHYFMAMSIIPAKNYLCTVSKIYRWSSTHEKFTEHQILTTRGAKKFASFNESGSSYLLVATMAKPCSIAGPSVVFKWNSATLRFESHQTLDANDIIDALAYNDGNGVRVVMAREQRPYPKTEASLEVWMWNGSALNLASTTQSFNVKAIRTFTVGKERCIAVAVNYDETSTRDEQCSLLYSVLGDRLVLSQKIYQYGIKDIVKFEADGNVFLLIAHFKASLGKKLRDGYLSLRKLSRETMKFLDVLSFPMLDPFQIDTVEVKGIVYVLVVSHMKSLRVMQFQEGTIFKELFNVNHIGISKASHFKVGPQSFLTLSAFTPLASNYRQTMNADSKILKIKLSGFHSSYLQAEDLKCDKNSTSK